MERTWNHTDPHIFGHWNGMEAYVYHFAGSGDRFVVLPRISWRQPSQPWKGYQNLELSAQQLRHTEKVALEPGSLHFKPKEPLGKQAQLICHGPYFSMESGNWEITLNAEAKAGYTAAFLRRFVFQLSLTSCHGKDIHARFRIPANFDDASEYRSRFSLKKPAQDFEFVIHTFPWLREFTLRSIGLKKIGLDVLDPGH